MTTIQVRQIDGDIMLDSAAMELLFGVAAERVVNHTRQSGNCTAPFPKAWIHQGRRRAREAAARTGSYEMLDSLRYWARKDHGADLVVVHQ